MTKPLDWHRLFGVMLTDFFEGSPYQVQLEVDLSLKQQFLDVVIVRRGDGEFQRPLPSGLEELTTHNLISFKSHREALDDWSLKELTGYYVAYRKQVSENRDDLIDENEFQLFGVCVRFPRKLQRQLGEFTPVSEGVYQVHRGTDSLRIIVLGEIPEADQNYIWELLSQNQERIKHGVTVLRRRSSELSKTLLNELLQSHAIEGLDMPFTIDDFFTHVAQNLQPEVIAKIPVEDRLKDIPVEERLKNVPVEERLKDIPVEERLKNVSIEEVLRTLPREQLLAYLKLLQENPSSDQPKDTN